MLAPCSHHAIVMNMKMHSILIFFIVTGGVPMGANIVWIIFALLLLISNDSVVTLDKEGK